MMSGFIGKDLDTLFNTAQDFVIDKTDRAIAGYRDKGYSRQEAIALAIAMQRNIIEQGRSAR